MGCVFGRNVSSSVLKDKESVSGKNLTVSSGTKPEITVTKIVSSNNTEVQNGNNRKEEKKDESRQSRGERGRPKPNPRLSNPPKNLHGEQVAAGWPAWLSAVAGEAIKGWTPRRADAFEKIDKVSFAFNLIV